VCNERFRFRSKCEGIGYKTLLKMLVHEGLRRERAIAYSVPCELTTGSGGLTRYFLYAPLKQELAWPSANISQTEMASHLLLNEGHGLRWRISQKELVKISRGDGRVRQE